MQHTSRRAFWLRQLKTLSISFGLIWILFTWQFEASFFGATFWAALLSLFLTGGQLYLTYDNLLTDNEVIHHILAGRR